MTARVHTSRILTIIAVFFLTLALEAPADTVPVDTVHADPPAPQKSILHPKSGVGSWIWDSTTLDRQECRFVRTFEIPRGKKVTSALLRITADNSYQVFLDGRQIGHGGDWRVLIEYDLHLLLTPGRHVLAVSALNDFDAAGLLLGLRVEFADGDVIEIASDASWKVAPPAAKDWLDEASAGKGSKWPAVKVLYPIYVSDNPMIYRAPVSLPVEIAFWQRKGFQIALIIVTSASVITGLFLASRLFFQSQSQRVIRRERARIAADLHDDLGGGLTRLVLLGETSRRDVPAGSPAAEALTGLCDQSRNLLRGMNETVWLINSQRDTIRDFASYVAKYAESLFQGTPVRCRFGIEDDLPPLPCDIGIRRNLFLAVKETLHNILRHSGATEAFLGVSRQRGDLLIEIRDNGRGFDPSAHAGPGNGTGTGNGLRNMAMRASEAGGRFTIENHPDGGTAVTFRVPLQAIARLDIARHFPWKRRRSSAGSPPP